MFGHANPALLSLSNKLELRVKAHAALNRERFGEVINASICDSDTVLIVTNDLREQNKFKVTDLSVLTD